MAVYKRGRIWWYKFTWSGEPIRESTKQTNKRTAEQIEAAHKTSLAKGEVGIRERSPIPTLQSFAEEKFLPFMRSQKSEKPRTVVFYETCVNNLKAGGILPGLRLDEIQTDHVTAFIEHRRKAGLKTSTINRDLATLRRMLRLSVEWEITSSARAVKLLSGEAHRERVLAEDEEERYLVAANPLLRAVGTIMLDCGLRPEECHRLKWQENIRDGAIEIHKGKRDGSRRRIEITPRVEAILEMLRPGRGEGWVFPADSKSGHIETCSYKKQHASAVRDSKVGGFVVYSLRHTCLTRWAKAGMDPFTLMYLAGHKSLATTMHYIHLAGSDAQARLQETRRKMCSSKAGSGHKIRHNANSLSPTQTRSADAIN